MKLRNEVVKTDVEAALQILNFAISHKELTDMEEREHQREMEMKQKTDQDVGHDDGNDVGNASTTMDPMDVDVDNASGDIASGQVDVSAERRETFEAILGQHVLANHLDQISVDEIEQIVNKEAARPPYTKAEVLFFLEGNFLCKGVLTPYCCIIPPNISHCIIHLPAAFTFFCTFVIMFTLRIEIRLRFGW